MCIALFGNYILQNRARKVGIISHLTSEIDCKEVARLAFCSEYHFNGVNPESAAMWESLDADTIKMFKQLSNVDSLGLISASTNFSEGRMVEKGEFDHIGTATTGECPTHLTQLDVRGSTWAIFESVGPFPDTLQNIWGRIYAEWFPSSTYELAEGPEILWNEHKDLSSPTFRSEIWIPVAKSLYTAE